MLQFLLAPFPLIHPRKEAIMLDIFFTDFVVFENKNQHLCFSVVWVLKSTFNSFSAKFFQEISLDNNCLTNPRILYWFIFLEKRGKHSRWRCHQAHDSRQGIWTTLSRGILWWSMFAFNLLGWISCPSCNSKELRGANNV